MSVVYKEYGIGLAFTPVVLSEGRISLKIETEVSELTQEGAVVLSGIQIPALKKRQANSTVELPSGGSHRHRRPAVGGHAAEHRWLSRPQGSADPRHAVPQPRLPEEGDRARRDRHAVHGAPRGAPGACAAARWPRRPDRSQGELPRPHQPHLRRRTRRLRSAISRATTDSSWNRRMGWRRIMTASMRRGLRAKAAARSERSCSPLPPSALAMAGCKTTDDPTRWPAGR